MRNDAQEELEVGNEHLRIRLKTTVENMRHTFQAVIMDYDNVLTSAAKVIAQARMKDETFMQMILLSITEAFEQELRCKIDSIAAKAVEELFDKKRIQRLIKEHKTKMLKALLEDGTKQ